MENIQQKLEKYNTAYVPGEIRSNTYNNKLRQETTLNNNIHRLHQLNQELPEDLQLNRCDIQISETLARTFHTRLKYLCRNCKKEVIFLVFLLYIKKIDNPKLDIGEQPISEKYGLTNNLYEIIISRALKHYMKQAPIPITTTTRYDHDKLIRNGGV